jgi:hypothetical protein
MLAEEEVTVIQSYVCGLEQNLIFARLGQRSW